jgi:hypothetical protein
MTQIIRINDVSLINKKHYGLVFTNESNLKKYFKNNNLEYYKCYSDKKLDIDISQVKNNKISILEEYDEQGLCKETLIYHNCFDELITNLKKQMKSIERSDGNGYINNIIFSISKKELLDGSVIYGIGYDKIIDENTGEDITYLFYNSYLLATNIPIINYL